MLIPADRARYLGEIASQAREINDAIERQAERAGVLQHCYEALRAMEDPALPAEFEAYAVDDVESDDQLAPLRAHYNEALEGLDREALSLLRGWDGQIESITAETYSYTVRQREVTGENYRRSLSQQLVPKIAPPGLRAGEIACAF